MGFVGSSLVENGVCLLVPLIRTVLISLHEIEFKYVNLNTNIINLFIVLNLLIYDVQILIFVLNKVYFEVVYKLGDI